MDNWQIFYNNVRDPSWPDCNSVEQFKNLPIYIQNEIRNQHRCEFLDCFHDFEFVDYVPGPRESWDQTQELEVELVFQIGDISVWYNLDMNGGGTGFGQNFSLVLKKIFPERNFENCLEWCAGPGFIGFRLLHDGICNKICFFEAYRPVELALQKTIQNLPERFTARVEYIISDDMSALGKSHDYDLIVANPPMFNHVTFYNSYGDSRKSFDWGWSTHQNFFDNVGTVLKQDGVICLVESIYGSSPEDFREMIESNGFEIIKAFSTRPVPDYYFILIQKCKN